MDARRNREYNELIRLGLYKREDQVQTSMRLKRQRRANVRVLDAKILIFNHFRDTSIQSLSIGVKLS